MARRQDEEGEDVSETSALRVCSDVEEAVYLLTKRDAVHFDRAALIWKCSVPAKALIRTRFGESFVTTLSLSGNRLQDSDMVLLANALVHNNCLLDLTLSYNAIAELGSTLLAAALAANSHLRTLDLRHNRIGKDGITPWLGPTMRANHSLRELKLSHNAIGNTKAVELLESLSPKVLTEEEQLKALIANRRRDTTIQEDKALLNDDEPFNSTLTTLLLSDAGISDEAAPYIEHVLARTRSLTHLNLSCNAFTSAGGIAIARGLKQNSTLRYLNYRENKVEESAAVALLSALVAHSFVGTALFQDCFGGESAVGTALSQLTRTSRTLATLDLVSIPLSPSLRLP
ncbi:hypothetical protein BBJ28_00000019 [Nothophytophthora sp. Chile5]|nr:hypothetical protein BBJ28_00000019 [Nothophytophthora sp. Chile5]